MKKIKTERKIKAIEVVETINSYRDFKQNIQSLITDGYVPLSEYRMMISSTGSTYRYQQFVLYED